MATTNSTPPGTSNPVMTIDTASLSPAQTRSARAGVNPLDPGDRPDPPGTLVSQENAASRGDSANPETGTGVDGELTVWEARYSNRNFLGRAAFRVLTTLAWGALAYYTWGENHPKLAVLTWLALGGAGLLWAGLILRMIQAHYSHFYRLTNRRLFLGTGVVHRRRDMMELLRVKDVFITQHSLLERWLGLGTVVVVPTEKELPTFYLAGVDDPKGVMDLIWHHARAERDYRSVKVDSI